MLRDVDESIDVADNTKDTSNPVISKSIHGAPNQIGAAGGIHNDTAVSQRDTIVKNVHQLPQGPRHFNTLQNTTVNSRLVSNTAMMVMRFITLRVRLTISSSTSLISIGSICVPFVSLFA